MAVQCSKKIIGELKSEHRVCVDNVSQIHEVLCPFVLIILLVQVKNENTAKIQHIVGSTRLEHLSVVMQSVSESITAVGTLYS